PIDGVVVTKHMEPGDLAVPGKPVLTLQDPRNLRLEVQVPERCAEKAAIGREVRVRIDALQGELRGIVDEVSPVADPKSRTFLAKVALPEDPGLRPGMFGRLLEDCGRRKVLLIPSSAVEKVGQLETVRVLGKDGRARDRHVRTGKRVGDDVEVLSGLEAGEKVVVSR
ncbi:MAG: efflux RND transporter periplasmic adaptor subunit, partial [Planctomycetota bacterium]